MRFVLNPGDGRDCVTFADGPAALYAFDSCRSDPSSGLYRIGRGRRLEVYASGTWFTAPEDTPIKVWEAARWAEAAQ